MAGAGYAEKIYMSIRETAKYTGLSEYYLRNMKNKPGLKSGNKFLVNVPALLEQLEQESERAGA